MRDLPYSGEDQCDGCGNYGVYLLQRKGDTERVCPLCMPLYEEIETLAPVELSYGPDYPKI